MRLIKARIQNYRSIIDTGLFDIETNKTILVGPNEAGKTAVLQALHKLTSGGSQNFDPLRDYPRSKYTEISTKALDVTKILIVEGHFKLEPSELADIPEGFEDIVFVYKKYLGNNTTSELIGGIDLPQFSQISNDFRRMFAHLESKEKSADSEALVLNSKKYIENLNREDVITPEVHIELKKIIDKLFPLIEEGNDEEEKRFLKIEDILNIVTTREKVLEICKNKLPKFILFNNFFRVKPLIHLKHLADRHEKNLLDDEYYDYGNLCLLKLLGFTPRELSNLGMAKEPDPNKQNELQKYRDQLDTRFYQLNAASVTLTNEIRKVWNPNLDKAEANKLRISADAQYLKVVVEDDMGVEVELDQRSEGFQWLVSFFIVFFAEADEKHENSILLLDEPGLSLHGLKQKEFQKTISRLSEKNQTIFTTHSPFLVGTNELDLVRVVEMPTRNIGTKVNTTITAGDSAALLPLQEALGYDLASTMFIHQKNLLLEGLTDYWYLQGFAELLKLNGLVELDESIALLPASGASKVVYFATILHSNNLKVAALLDSDSAGDAAANQNTLVHMLGNRGIIRTKDVYQGAVKNVEIEELIRETLVEIAKSEFSYDISSIAQSHPTQPIIDIFKSHIDKFSKYKLAKAFLKWVGTHSLSDLTGNETNHVKELISQINRSLK